MISTRVLAIGFFTGCLLCGVNASAQTFSKGYIINLKGDTLKGEVKQVKSEVELFNKVFFKVSEVEKKSYKADKIREYGFDGKTYVARQVDGEPVFLKRLSAGAANLYEFQYEMQGVGNNIVVKSEYYMEKGKNNELVKIKSGKFKKQLSEAMSDNEEIINGLESEKYEYENIVDLFEQYNQWHKDHLTKG